MANVRLTTGDTSTQLGYEMQSTSQQDREKLIEGIKKAKKAGGDILITIFYPNF